MSTHTSGPLGVKMKVLRAWWAKVRGQMPVSDEVICHIDACDYGRRHQLIHVRLVNNLPVVVKQLKRECSKHQTYYNELDSICIIMPKQFLSLAHSAEAEEIIYEYLLKHFSYQVKDCRLRRFSNNRLSLKVEFRTDSES